MYEVAKISYKLRDKKPHSNHFYESSFNILYQK